jgi:hypothetical protein
LDVRRNLAAEAQSLPELQEVDSAVQLLLEASYRNTTVTAYGRIFRGLREALLRMRVAMVAGVATVTSAPSRSVDAERIVERLEEFSPAIADSYRQVLSDLEDANRISFRGTANDLREILREVVDGLAPDEDVRRASWYVPTDSEGQRKNRPTMADRTRFAIEAQRTRRGNARQVSTTVERVDDLLGAIVRSTYDRASAAVHSGRARTEVQGQLRYLNAILLELLER